MTQLTLTTFRLNGKRIKTFTALTFLQLYYIFWGDSQTGLSFCRIPDCFVSDPSTAAPSAACRPVTWMTLATSCPASRVMSGGSRPNGNNWKTSTLDQWPLGHRMHVLSVHDETFRYHFWLAEVSTCYDGHLVCDIRLPNKSLIRTMVTFVANSFSNFSQLLTVRLTRSPALPESGNLWQRRVST